MDGWMDGWMDVWMFGCWHVSTAGWAGEAGTSPVRGRSDGVGQDIAIRKTVLVLFLFSSPLSPLLFL